MTNMSNILKIYLPKEIFKKILSYKHDLCLNEKLKNIIIILHKLYLSLINKIINNCLYNKYKMSFICCVEKSNDEYKINIYNDVNLYFSVNINLLDINNFDDIYNKMNDFHKIDFDYEMSMKIHDFIINNYEYIHMICMNKYKYLSNKSDIGIINILYRHSYYYLIESYSNIIHLGIIINDEYYHDNYFSEFMSIIPNNLNKYNIFEIYDINKYVFMKSLLPNYYENYYIN